MSGKHALVGIPGTAPRPGPQADGLLLRSALRVRRRRQCTIAEPPLERCPPSHEVRCYPPCRRFSRDSAAAATGGDAESRDRGRGRARRRPRRDASYGPVRCCTTSSSSSARASASRSWASRAPARRRSRAASPGCTRATRARSSFRGQPLPPGSRARDAKTRREIQYVFQSPYSSLNPRKTIGQIIGQPLRQFFSAGGSRGREPSHGGARDGAALDDVPRALPAPAVGRRAPARGDRPRAGRRARSSSSATRSRPRSTSPCRPRSSTCSPICSASSISGCSSSRTTSR